MNTGTLNRGGYELWFQSLKARGKALHFPCDAAGQVDLDALGRRSLYDYLYARVVMGREFALPDVRPVDAGA